METRTWISMECVDSMDSMESTESEESPWNPWISFMESMESMECIESMEFKNEILDETNTPVKKTNPHFFNHPTTS